MTYSKAAALKALVVTLSVGILGSMSLLNATSTNTANNTTQPPPQQGCCGPQQQ